MGDSSVGGIGRPESFVEALLFRFPNGTLNIYDRDFRYLCVGGDGLEAVGLTAGYLQGKTLYELFPPASIALVEPFYRRAFAGERVRFGVVLFGRDYYISAGPFQYLACAVASIIVVAQDVTMDDDIQRLEVDMSRR